MKLLNTKTRLLLCLFIIAAFFIPAYNNVSGFNFISIALSEAKTPGEVTLTDVIIVLAPLVIIPISALVIFIRSAIHLSTRKTFISLPFLFLAFFFAVILLSARNISTELSGMGALFNMQLGFYLAAASSALLIFTKNSGKKRAKKFEPEAETMIAA